MRVFLVTSLLCCVLYPISLLAASAEKSAPAVDFDCEESVDAADDMNFADNIIECNEEAVVIYDQESRQKFLSRKALPLKTYENQQLLFIQKYFSLFFPYSFFFSENQCSRTHHTRVTCTGCC